MNILIELIGWIASVLIVGSYALNITGRLSTDSKRYVWANILGGLFFVINTYFHQAYPSMVVNIIWVFIAIIMIVKRKKKQP
jgi:purine-cytosine permease-like protein